MIKLFCQTMLGKKMDSSETELEIVANSNPTARQYENKEESTVEVVRRNVTDMTDSSSIIEKATN